MKTIDPELQKKFDIANKLFKEKKYKDSAKKYEDILIENPNSISIKNNLALCYEGLREFEKAVKLYKECIDAKPDTLFFNNKLHYGSLYDRKKHKKTHTSST